MRERCEELDGQPVFWREAERGGTPVLYVHGVPESSDMWLPFLERSGGIAVDLPGFGRSGKRGDLAYDMPFYDAWVERFVQWRGLERVRLVVHDWGCVGLLWAQRFPERVERLVIADAVPLLPGYRWHRLARAWRTPLVGEVAIGLMTRSTMKLSARFSRGGQGPMAADFIERVAAHLDQGTQRAILRLYRAADPDRLAAAGAGLGAIGCPALVVWGEGDPYLPPRFADAYAEALGGPVNVVRVPGAGHWPWFDSPELIDTITTFLD
jgi:pimeloyl-ACP methyl ester carboxylesterase